MEELFKDLPVRRFRKGQILIYEGDPVDDIFFLQAGYVKVSNISADGSRHTIVLYAPGDAFPLTSFLSGRGTASNFYECLTDVEVKLRPQADFRRLIRGNLEIGEKLISYTYKANQQFVERIETLSAASARRKILSLLKYLSRRAGTRQNGKTRINVPLTSQEIADMCSLTRETASMQLVRLRKEGVMSGRRLITVDRAKLEKLRP